MSRWIKRLVIGFGLVGTILGVGTAGRAQIAIMTPEEHRLPAMIARDEIDAATTAQVEKALANDPVVSSGVISVQTKGGVVTLLGTVRNLGTRGRAGLVAQNVPGVGSVINRLEIDASTVPMDATIRNAVVAAFRNAGRFQFPYVGIRVESGVVFLSGRVRTEQTKDWATQIARDMPNVAAVRNDLTVGYDVPPPDQTITGKIQAAVMRQAFANPNAIRVDVMAGRAVLSGTVASLEERARAIQDAWDAGAKAVDASRLEIQRLVLVKAVQTEYILPTDAEIARLVWWRLLQDGRIDATLVRPEVVGRVVTLRGAVDSLLSRQVAEADAATVVGVRGVVNQLEVQALAPVFDPAVFGAAVTALRRDPAIDSSRVSVTVLDGVVSLYGTVDSLAQRVSAENLMTRVPGVRGVENNLVVQEPAVGQAPAAIQR